MAGSANTQAHHTQFGKRRVPRGRYDAGGATGGARWPLGGQLGGERGKQGRGRAGASRSGMLGRRQMRGVERDRASEITSGDVRANLGGHPAPRPPGDRRLHGWCRKTLKLTLTLTLSLTLVNQRLTQTLTQTQTQRSNSD